ncbi:ABC transporter permease [Nannocystis sp. RBIL2]|uniref:ABC transporter permease n=1 Tax=Nannocystis sp. RBIL2 TaxID=2996788 RepID=UPI00226E4499|nr:ABC transporter permease [Nannocystis sp. RBIL2]MCY1071849.1 ABC transporter permease [Nannocystis sp. RBIL2]
MIALLRELRFAARVLAKSPSYTFVAVFTLALGIGANTAIFSTVNAVLLRPLPYEQPERLVVLTETQPKFEEMSVAYLNYVDYRQQSSTFVDMGAFNNASVNITGQGEPERLKAQQFSQSVLPVLGVEPLLGRNFLAEEDRPHGPKAVILTHGFWQRRFAGDPDIVGEPITLDGAPWDVVGVMPPDFRFFGTSDVIIPIGLRADDLNYQSRGSHPGITVVGRLKPAVTIEQATTDLRAVGDGLAKIHEQVQDTRARLQDMHEDLVEDLREGILLLYGAVMFVLLITAANVANLMLARAMTRQKEMRIRAALGSGRWRLIRQLLVESSLLGLVGGAMGLLIALWGVDLLAAARPQAIEVLGPVEIDAPVLAYTLAVGLGTGLLFGLVPAIYASRQDLAQALKEADHRATAAGGHLRIRNLLVVFEVALALVLLVGAGLSLRGFARLTDVDPGFEPGDILTMELSLPTARYDTATEVRRFWTELERRVAEIPGVVSASASSGLPFAGASESSFLLAGEPRVIANTKMAVAYFVDAGYFETLKIPLHAGRTFTTQDTTETPLALVIDQALADKFFPGQDPIGQQLQEGMTDKGVAEIVGVVGHVAHYGLDGPQRTQYQMYYAYRQLPEQIQARVASGMTLSVRTQGDPLGYATQVREAVTAVDPDQPVFAVQTLEQYIADSVAPRRFTSALLSVFAGLALLLAAVGLYATMANSVAQRTHELGVRMALGAQPRHVVWLVVRQGLVLIVAGAALGLVGALALTRLMTSLLTQQVSPTDPATYFGVTLLLVVIGLLAAYVPARRATRIDPIGALRQE